MVVRGARNRCARRIVFHYGPLRRTMVVPHGRELPESSVAPMAPNYANFVFSSGSIGDPARNIEVLARCVPRLSWPVIVGGDTTSPAGAAIALPNVTCLGPLSPADIAQWMERAPIYALPARYEPFGLSVLEAALAGCALVLGDIRSLREVWGDAALYVPPGNGRALSAASQALIDNPAISDALAGRSYRRARLLTPARMAQGYCDAYARLANQPKAAISRSHALPARLAVG